MNDELIERKINQIMEIYETNDRVVPNAVRMRRILGLNYLKRHQFGEFVILYKKCNGGYS